MPHLDRSVLVDVDVDVARKVVNDVASYPQFVPGCVEAEILDHDDDEMRARLTVEALGHRESFTSRNVQRETSVVVELEDGPFDHLRGEWSFKPLSKTGCRVSLELDFRPKGVIAMVLSGAAPMAADKIVTAFVRRMREVAQCA